MQQHAATPHARAGEPFLLSECYASIQGESSFVGTPTIFVRLYTCNLRCAWCDSMHAVAGGDYREVTVAARAGGGAPRCTGWGAGIPARRRGRPWRRSSAAAPSPTPPAGPADVPEPAAG